MKNNIRINATKLFFSVLSVICVMSAASPAQAIEGCDPKVMDAMKAKAQAKVAYDVAVAEEIIKKPDSVLALTCFNRSAAISATQGGAVFSGNFITDLVPIIKEALEAFYDDFEGSEGSDNGISVSSGQEIYSAATTDVAATNMDCDGIKNLWNTVQATGVNQGVPYMTMDDLMNNNIPASAGEKFTANMEASQAVMDNLNAKMDQVPRPSVPSFAGTNTSCEVLTQAYGSTPPGC